MRVAVLGAAGTIARAIVRDLGESPEVSGMLLIDLNREGASRVAEQHGCGKAMAGEPASTLAAALEDCELLVNAASYRINLDAMEAALERDCHYIDLGGLYWMTARQLELHERFERAGLLGLLGMGASPGKTNVMAVRAVRELRGVAVEAIDVSAAGRDPEIGAALRTPYSLRTLLDEVTLAPVVLEAGRPRELEPLAPGGVVDFPLPIGPADTIHTLHSELRTFGTSFGCAGASFRLSLAPALLARLRELAGVEGDLPRTEPPSPETISAHVVEARGGGRRVRVSALTTPMDLWGLGGGIVSTAAPAAAAVRLIASQQITRRGVLPPELCVDPDDLFPELERRNCRFEVSTA